MSDQIEIRLLGRLYVRRANGEVVDAQEWNTAKATDLLRLLALDAGSTVNAIGLIEKLWPGVPEEKAMSSLRTAASHIRKVIGSNCIERHLGGLVLRDCWVDVAAFRGLATDAATSMRSRDFVRVVTIAREAESLYAADFRAHDDDSFWASEARDGLKTSRQALIADAGEAAAHLHWWRDAIDFSRLAIVDDPCFERPHRTLMRAHAGLGETELALRAFEHCRRSLSDELGADPSPQTSDLHIRILSGAADEQDSDRFVGRQSLAASITSSLRGAMSDSGLQVVCVVGPSGSGRQAILRAASDSIPRARLLEVSDSGDDPVDSARLGDLLGARRSDFVVWGPVDGAPKTQVARIRSTLEGLDPAAEGVVVVLTSESTGRALEASPLAVRVCDVAKTTEQDLQVIATDVLSAPPTPALFEKLMSQNQGLAGRTVSLLREWMATGAIISTRHGLDLYDTSPEASPGQSTGARYRAIVESLQPGDIDLCQLMAVVDRPVTVEELVAFEGPDRRVNRQLETLHGRLDRLSDKGVVRMTAHAYEFRSRPMRDVFEMWMRPSVRSRLSRIVDGIPSGVVEVEFDRRSASDIRTTGDRRVGPRGRRATDLH